MVLDMEMPKVMEVAMAVVVDEAMVVVVVNPLLERHIILTICPRQRMMR